MELISLFNLFKKDLRKVETELYNACLSSSDVNNLAVAHVLKAGGKRIRPIFLLLCAKFGNYDMETLKYSAAALEIIHSASLIHDDVIDCADIRRGKPTVAQKWGNMSATYSGDYMFAHAMQLIAKLGKISAHKLMASTITELCLGELEQIKDRYNTKQTIRKYLQKIKRKTALLMATSCKLGALTAEVNEYEQKLFNLYGYYLGMSYQINDDIFDFVSNEKKLGKPAGHDLIHGNITLPVIYAMEDPLLNRKIQIINEKTSLEYIKNTVSAINNSGAINKSIALSKAYARKASEIVDSLPEHTYKKYLYLLANKIYDRSY